MFTVCVHSVDDFEIPSLYDRQQQQLADTHHVRRHNPEMRHRERDIDRGVRRRRREDDPFTPVDVCTAALHTSKLLHPVSTLFPYPLMLSDVSNPPPVGVVSCVLLPAWETPLLSHRNPLYLLRLVTRLLSAIRILCTSYVQGSVHPFFRLQVSTIYASSAVHRGDRITVINAVLMLSSFPSRWAML